MVSLLQLWRKLQTPQKVSLILFFFKILVDRGSTRKGNYSEYRKILSGKIEYEPPISHAKGFSGYIKLKKDPRAEPLSEEHFVPRGSVIKNTDW